MKTATRDEISLNDLQAVMDAAVLLRKYGLIGVAKIREVREAVHEDCNVNLERHGGSDDIARMVNDVWRQTRPL